MENEQGEEWVVRIMEQIQGKLQKIGRVGKKQTFLGREFQGVVPRQLKAVFPNLKQREEGRKASLKDIRGNIRLMEGAETWKALKGEK